jgi:glutamine---fructose-6-phosphate transaminase (isomerizing)
MNDSHLNREIHQQPATMRFLLENELPNIQHIARIIRERSPQYIMLAARGSSDNAGRYGQYLFGTANHLAVALATPSLFTLYKQVPRLDGALVIAISQSGQSPDIVAVAKEGKRQNALTLAITDDPASPLAQSADYCIRLLADKEKSVAATRTYTASLLVQAMLSAALAEDEERLQTLQTLPDMITNVLKSADDTLQAAERYRYMQACVINSRGYNYATAYELALKLKELTYVLAEPYSSADFQHGPVALIEHGFPVIAIVPEGEIEAELVNFLKILKGRGAELIVISGLPEALDLAQTPLPLPTGIPEWLSPLVAVVQGQLFAMGLTLAKGYDPDHPRGLMKVTLTK